LNEVSAAVPEVVEVARALPARQLILDGETIALREDGRPHPFQVTMRRFGRRLDVDAQRRSLPLSTLFFDVVLLDDEVLLDAPARDRTEALGGLSAPTVERLVTADPEAADGFLAGALARGHEGVMAKAVDAPYEAGQRGASWLKLKPAHTLDLVVVAAEWGSGRRQGWLSNLHLAARAPSGFAMLGKTFKGLTDAVLEDQTRALLAREVGREGHVVHVRPELVVEIALDGVQASPHYPAGLALRFARVKRYRPDKTPAQASTLDEVRALHESS
jgi:DNA ligase-1